MPGISLQIDAKTAYLGQPIVEVYGEGAYAGGGVGAVYDVLLKSSVFLFTGASSNWTWNLRGDSTTTFGSLLWTADYTASMTLAMIVPNGATPYFTNGLQIDGVTQTVKWQGGTAPTAGNANAIDVYSFTIFRTGESTYTVLGSQTKFA